MICFLICPMVVVLLYAIAQTRLILRLIHLLRQPGRIAQFGLAESCVVTLCILPGLMLLLLTALLVARGRYMDDSGNSLTLMTFTRYGAAFALCSWVVMTIWFRRIVRRDLAIYREPVALVPVVIMSLICLNYVAIGAWQVASSMLKATSFMSWWQPSIEGCLSVAIMIYIPAAPLAGFMLLIVHVALVRAAKTWETYIPDEQEEMP